MRNKPLIITLIVLLSIIAILLTVFLVLAIFGVEFPGFANNSFRNINKNIIFEQNYEPEHIEKIDIFSDAGNVKILETSENSIKVDIYGKSDKNLGDINFSNENGTLKFEIRGMRNKFLNFGFSENDIVIYAPKEIIKEIEIKSSYGDIEIGEFENALVDLKQDCGDIDIGKIQNATILHLADCDLEAFPRLNVPSQHWPNAAAHPSKTTDWWRLPYLRFRFNESPIVVV